MAHGHELYGRLSQHLLFRIFFVSVSQISNPVVILIYIISPTIVTGSLVVIVLFCVALTFANVGLGYSGEIAQLHTSRCIPFSHLFHLTPNGQVRPTSPPQLSLS